ncbi:MAG TPA: SUMF1/EgtB/PvdO family nonheme iron enzyme [Bryobacteraceae bacterium]|nr:SUMF1/EgtB/PvdO family nonheme iron enzyme [Bryobacteraceae bacterium]
MLNTVFALLLAATSDGFVSLPGGTLQSHNIDAFEMCERPVTNTEWKKYVDAAGRPHPLHWTGGRIPAGLEKHPVVYVSRHDVAEYTTWRSRVEKRPYRLPTVMEFEYAARAGTANKYPWGDDPAPANFDPSGDRTFAQWRTFLKAVKHTPANSWGLYDMAGNIWQMVDSMPDPAVVRFKYRVEKPDDLENGVAGGSWARSEYYLRIGVRGTASPGIRHPDLGFRVVRQPAGMTHFETQPRRIAVAPVPGGVYVSWQLLPGEAMNSGFHVYRSTRRDVAGDRITTAPVATTTDFVDAKPPAKGRVYYRVRAVADAGKEGPPSEWTAIELPVTTPTGLVAKFQPTVQDGGVVPVFGDLDGDGKLDAVLRLNHGITEMSRDPGVPVELEAMTSYGRSLWRRPLVSHDKAFGSANNVPVVVWDLDGNGKAEVIARLQDGDKVYVAVLDGMTGRVLRKAPWADMVSDFAKSSTRIHMAIAYLNGKTPSVITQTGLYENEVLEAFDVELKKLWRFESLGDTNGSGSHHIDIADVDGDGRDEVFDGTTVLNGDGTMRWSIYREHPDIVAVKHIIPGRKGRQVFYAVESSVHAGAYVVDAATGKIIWKSNREDDARWSHAHTGWAADILASSPGLEMYTNRDGHLIKDTVLLSAEGKVLMEGFPSGWKPLNWTGGEVRDLISGDGKRLVRFTGKGMEPITGTPNEGAKGSFLMSADLAGDYRDEVVCIGPDEGGKLSIMVYTNTTPATRRAVTRTADREYSLWLARNIGAGYASYFEWQE